MLTQHSNALFLSAEEKSFKNKDGEVIEYMRAKLLGDENEYIECTVQKEIQEDVLQLDPRTEVSAEISITEEVGWNNQPKLKKRLIGIS